MSIGNSNGWLLLANSLIVSGQLGRRLAPGSAAGYGGERALGQKSPTDVCPTSPVAIEGPAPCHGARPRVPLRLVGAWCLWHRRSDGARHGEGRLGAAARPLAAGQGGAAGAAAAHGRSGGGERGALCHGGWWYVCEPCLGPPGASAATGVAAATVGALPGERVVTWLAGQPQATTRPARFAACQSKAVSSPGVRQPYQSFLSRPLTVRLCQ